MLIPPPQAQLLRMIRRALQDQNPEKFKTLEQQGSLPVFLTDQAEQMREAYGTAQDYCLEAMDQYMKDKPTKDAAPYLQ